MPWLDPLCLHDPDHFLDIATSNPRVRAIACGHVHRAYDTRVRDVDVYTAPSTAVQFCRKERRVVTDKPPGYRMFALSGEDVSSEAVFLPELTYPIEPRLG